MHTRTTATQRTGVIARGARFAGKLRPRSGYDVVALLAMFVALGTGGAYAANTIGSADVIDNSLTSADIQDVSLKGQDIAPGAIKGGAIATGAIDGAKVEDDSLSGFDIDESLLAGSQIPGTDPRVITVYKRGGTSSAHSRVTVVYCPDGMKAVGTGYDIVSGSEVDVAFTSQMILYRGEGVIVRAHERTPSINPWELIAQAECADVRLWQRPDWNVWGVEQ
jgi:hypothetical protein